MRVNSNDPKILQDFLALKLKLSRRAAKDVIDARRAWVNRKCVWMARFALATDDVVETQSAIPKAPVKFHIRVIWRNDDYLVCDKPAGMISSADPKSVESRLREQEKLPNLEAVHRLDRDTSGCLMLAKSHAAKLAAVEVFKTHKVSKIYHAIVAGAFKFVHQTISSPLDGQTAVTKVTRESAGPDASFLKVAIETSRTNQIRRHLASIRFPIIGDRVFGLKHARDARLMKVPRQMLHASTLSLPNPMNLHEEIKVHSPLPADFRAALKLFRL